MIPLNPGVPEPQVALNKIKILENGDPLVDLRQALPELTFHGCEGEGRHPYLRAPVAAMLKQAAAGIGPEFQLCVLSALRSFACQTEIWHKHYNRYKTLHPEWSEHTLRRAVNKYVAPVNHPAPPGHCTGGAVDVVLQKPDGSFVDLVPPDLEDWSLGHTWTTKIDPALRKIRMQLVEAMLSAGFSNCRDEYWHYSWGDSAWAVRTGAKTCPYGVVALPNE